ncbi:MAG: OmpA family protein [Pseudomonadales bacterium]|nr:OmpA family protein [Pseudomonadales bacterium]
MYRLNLLLVIFLQGCSHWPDRGFGGMAEHNIGNISPVMAHEALGPEHGLRFDLELTSRHLDMLVLEGAELCFPATVLQSKQRQRRIAREVVGKLHYDAANDLIVQRGILARLERQLNYVTSRGLCRLPVIQSQKKLTVLTPKPEDNNITDIINILNSDNQFATNSSELNPKYIGRLSEAATLLKTSPNIQVDITGHADTEGNSKFNHKLALDRAKMVGRYLNIFGIKNSRIHYDEKGEEKPLYHGTEPHTRLVNRRVRIELVPITTTINEK